MRVIYAFESLPENGHSAIFLAGPTPRAGIGDPALQSWRRDAIDILERIGYKGDVLIPEPRDGWRPDYNGQIEWECYGRKVADIIAFWVPRELTSMPAFTTNIEFGEDLPSGKVLYGRPDNAPKNRYLDARYSDVMKKSPHRSLEALMQDIVNTIGQGARREKGERHVPLWVWKTPSFQSWYAGQRQHNNTINDFDVQTLFRFGAPPENIFGWIAKVNIHIASENRNKTNESVVARTDTSMVVPILTDTPNNDILLVQEFRSPGNTSKGFVVEPPAGSSLVSKDPRMVALEELCEETGLDNVAANRLHYVSTRQLAATMLTHQMHVFALKLTPEESTKVRQKAKDKVILGANPFEDNGERITLDIVSQDKLLESDVDWTVLGAIAMATKASKYG